MAGPRFLVENFFNLDQFSGHTLTANEETTGNEAWRVGAGRRVGGTIRNYWTPTTANQLAWVRCQCDRVRAADTLIIDRGHNLDAEALTLQVSDDVAFSATGTTTILNAITLPATVHANSRMSDVSGVKTTEGAWVVLFPFHVGLYWRVFVAAMGASLKPQIPGLYLGNSFTPTNNPPRPWDDEPTELSYDSIKSESLWSASSRKAKRRATSVEMFMASDVEMDQAHYHFRSLYQRGDLMWYVPDTDNAERAWLAEAPQGTDAQVYPTNFQRRVVSVGMVEHNPKAR